MSGPEATVDGLAAPVAAAIDEAARLLAGARRVLVTGLADAPLEAITAACDLAESLGAAIDAGAAEIASPAGPVIARAGGITADPEELDRADLVVGWFCDAARIAAEAERLGLNGGRGSSPRLRLAVGPECPAGWRHLELAATAAVDAARLVQLHLAGCGPAFKPIPEGGHDEQAPWTGRRGGRRTLAEHRGVSSPATRLLPPASRRDTDPGFAPDRFPPPLADAAAVLAAAIRSANCVGFLTADWPDDRVGLAAWALAHLVRCIAHEKPAFTVPLVAEAESRGNAAGAAAVLTWRYGGPGGIARADRDGGRFQPAECDAVSLIERGEVDAVLAVGRLPVGVEAAIADRAADLGVVRLDGRRGELPGMAGRSVHVCCDVFSGTVLGPDGREVMIPSGDPAAEPLATLLGRLHDRIQELRQ